MGLKNPEALKLKQVMEEMTTDGSLYERLEDGRLHCYACGHDCKIPEGKAGACRIRFNEGGRLKVPAGYVGSLACDPIEKKPFFHAFPGSDAFSFGMLGCDLKCGYCQNWITSQVLRDDRAVSKVYPTTADQLVDAAIGAGAPVIASTYNEPLITSEWSAQVFRRAMDKGLVGAYISNGNATERVIEFLRPHVQLYKVDLKSFQDRAYRQLGAHRQNVLRTIRQLHARGFWVEIVTLIVPGLNDSTEELEQIAEFLVSISPDLPWHVTGFHSDYKMDDAGSTPVQKLIEAAEIGAAAGLRYVYAGNRPGQVGDWENTRCPGCDATLIERHGFLIRRNRLEAGGCPDCGMKIPGFWDRQTVVPQENMGTPHWLERGGSVGVERG
ncbi:MAG: AmmeMemoRadiSam system radical SAM enzyme [Phycisphaeraceae bacterium]|nr:AmmeMemoRadiSam system radical SAM enzyme [Phycisphaeraceae bacterium]